MKRHARIVATTAFYRRVEISLNHAVTIRIRRLFIHPVKSMRGIGLTHALADVSGLAFDRIFMITEPDGTFITARQFPLMVRFTAI